MDRVLSLLSLFHQEWGRASVCAFSEEMWFPVTTSLDWLLDNIFFILLTDSKCSESILIDLAGLYSAFYVSAAAVVPSLFKLFN